MDLRKKKSAGTLEKSHEIRLLRKDAARILTALNQKAAAEPKAVKEKAAPVKVAAKKISKEKVTK